MTREHKYRVWNTRWNKMEDAPITNHSMDTLNNVFEVYKTDKEHILMQYTGLKDKNGKEIYEGDIMISEFSSEKVIVEWKDLGDAGATYGVGFNAYEGDEVIGDIYSNPELIK